MCNARSSIFVFWVLLTAAAAAAQTTGSQPASPSPLTLHVGNADLLLGGFMDATVVWRSTNHGTGLGTSFGTIPFGNTPQGHMSETRFSAQNSRLTLLATSTVGTASLKGYVEADFLGNAPNGLNVTSNSNTLRMRLFWAQYRRGKVEFLAGQSWSMLTPNRMGISPVPGDLFYTQDVDTNYQMGLIWERTTQFRFVAHATDTVTAGVSIANPEQYVGSGVVLPPGFPAFEVDAGSVTVGTPNRYPDVAGKIAFDPRTGKTHQHVEAAFLTRGFGTYNPATDASFTATGSGVSINAVFEPVRSVHVAATSFFSNGGGRYIANANLPDLVVNGDGSITLVKSRAFMVGPEVAVGNSLLYAYYSHATADQAIGVGATPIGFGVPGTLAANHTIDEASFGLTQTFFHDARIGAMQLMVQYSNVKRTPFSVPAGTPPSASLNMAYVNVRYVLP